MRSRDAAHPAFRPGAPRPDRQQPLAGQPNDNRCRNKRLAEKLVPHFIPFYTSRERPPCRSASGSERHGGRSLQQNQVGPSAGPFWRAPPERCPGSGRRKWVTNPIAGERRRYLLSAPRRRRFGCGRLVSKAASGPCQPGDRCYRYALEIIRSPGADDCRRTPKGGMPTPAEGAPIRFG